MSSSRRPAQPSAPRAKPCRGRRPAGPEAGAPGFIHIRHCREHNLQNISLRIPLRRLTLVCGVSGSGKSTLAHDVLFSEGQARFLASFPAYTRIFQAQPGRSRTEAITHMPPALCLGQRLALNQPRSTVATLTGLHGLLRMLFSRFASHNGSERLSRSHFSFNHPLGACVRCQGLGDVQQIDPGMLVADNGRSLRQGALSLSTPNGYIVYSQVTLDVLDQVCRAHGFSVDVPWRELADSQRRIVLYGSDRLQVPFGKHPLASRLRWSGITPKPRQLGVYRGIVPIMEEILQRDPNPNILRFCRRQRCPDCGGLRLSAAALDASFGGTCLRQLLPRSVGQIASWAGELRQWQHVQAGARRILSDMEEHSLRLQGLSLGHLPLARAVPTLSRSEGQRIQTANLLRHPISGMLYVVDEPGSGLHPREKKPLYRRFRALAEAGATVVMVSHDRQALEHADWVVELGPAGGRQGGRLLFCGSSEEYTALGRRSPAATPTLAAWRQKPAAAKTLRRSAGPFLSLGPIQRNTLDIEKLDLHAAALVGITGLSGSGKTSLLEWLLERGKAGLAAEPPIRRVISVDQQPLGKNARSNPATYTKLFDDIRRLFAAQPQAQKLGLSASSFSFNTEQGSCPVCQGAGVIEITMHFLPTLTQPCSHCRGRRYQERVLGVHWQGLAIDEVLDLTVDQALTFFACEAKIAARLQTLAHLGLGYLTLGQPSSTLSGGEAQRVRLASFLEERRASNTLILLDEPCQGLHDNDIAKLLGALRQLRDHGASLVVAENNPLFLQGCDQHITLRAAGGPQDDRHRCTRSRSRSRKTAAAGEPRCIRLQGVRTHNLQNVSVDIPEGRLTVVSGPSGAGKSSLALETLYKICLRRHAEQLSPYLRDRLSLAGEDDCDRIEPLKPAVALAARYVEAAPRSTVGTLSGIHDLLRVLFSRAGDVGLRAAHFSFNHQDGACPACAGLGQVHRPHALRWLADSGKSILDGAFSSHKACQFFLDPHGRHMAVLQSAARHHGIDLRLPWRDLGAGAQRLVLEGCAGEFDVVWRFQRGRRRGEHRFRSGWIGLNPLVLHDHARRRAHKLQAGRYAGVVGQEECPSCRGLRLKPTVLQSRIGSLSLGAMLAIPLQRLLAEVAAWSRGAAAAGARSRPQRVAGEVLPILERGLRSLVRLGVGYLALGRSADSLSSGEHQRLRLASLLATPLNHCLFVLDEASRGLHPCDVGNLLVVLRRLLEGGNTVVAVDPHPMLTAEADWNIRLGPGGGRRGGRVVFLGREKRRAPELPRMPTPAGPSAAPGVIRIRAVRLHNLDVLDLTFPARGLTVLCGVSGSGKSTLLRRVLGESAAAGRPLHCAALEGLERFARVVPFTPQNPSRFGAERVAAFLGVRDSVYEAFTLQGETPAARSRLLKKLQQAKAESLCRHCQGAGEWKTDLDYMGTFVEPCRHCQGSGLAAELGRLAHKGLTLQATLASEIDSLPAALVADCRLPDIVATLREFSLGYLALNRRLRTLSAGELQRLRLARLFLELHSAPSLLLLDEPDSGLDRDECRQLLLTMKRRLQPAHAAVVISHQPMLMGQADYLVELGPGAGEEGGRLVACGTPQQIATGRWPLSRTAAFLKQSLTPLGRG